MRVGQVVIFHGDDEMSSPCEGEGFVPGFLRAEDEDGGVGEEGGEGVEGRDEWH